MIFPITATSIDGSAVPASGADQRRAELLDQIRQKHERSLGLYGSPRIHAELLLLDNRIDCSMSRTGNCYDNAAMESFWGTLKQELIYQESYPTRAAAKQSIFEYIEVFYNRQRRHSAIGYVIPESFEASLN